MPPNVESSPLMGNGSPVTTSYAAAAKENGGSANGHGNGHANGGGASLQHAVSSASSFGHKSTEEEEVPLKNSEKSEYRDRLRDRRINVKTQSTFWEDARQFNAGSIPHSMLLALIIGAVCGISAWLYYAVLWWILEFLWHTLPQQIIAVTNNAIPEYLYVLWIPIVGFSMAAGVGLSVRLLGEPGDLPYTVKCVHEKAYLAMDHVAPMVAASQCSILAGGSLGPEAPLVAICASLGGFVSRTIFRTTERNLVRKHTLMGMAGALAAFFGCPLGGSLFAMEVNSRFGIEYFEHTLEAILCGEVTLVVFRAAAGLPIDAIWKIKEERLEFATPTEIVYGAILGLVGALVSWLFANFHWKVMHMFERLNLLNNEHAIGRAMLGAVVVVVLGMLVPHTMFWGEYEFQTVATGSPASTLEHIWPTSGLIGFEMKGFWTCLITGVAKLIAISFTVSGGYRGGYIFPAFLAAAALGRAIYCVFPQIPVQICVLGMAAAINVSLTRTAIATTLILAYLSGEPCAISPVLASSLVALFVTGYMPFIKSQMTRADMDESLYYSDDYPMASLAERPHIVEQQPQQQDANGDGKRMEMEEDDEEAAAGGAVNIVV